MNICDIIAKERSKIQRFKSQYHPWVHKAAIIIFINISQFQLLCNILGPLTMTVRMTLDYLTILSVGRLTAIAFPFHFRTVFSFRKTLLYVFVFFLFSFTQYVFVPATGGRFTPLGLYRFQSLVKFPFNLMK